MTTAETHSAREYSALLRTDFASFAQHCFHELNPRTLFAASWYHDIIAAKLAVRTGRRRLIINVLPCHLTSHLASVAFPAWCLGLNPACRSPASATRRTSPTNCRAIAGGSSPTTGTGSSLPLAFR